MTAMGTRHAAPTRVVRLLGAYILASPPSVHRADVIFPAGCLFEWTAARFVTGARWFYLFFIFPNPIQFNNSNQIKPWNQSSEYPAVVLWSVTVEQSQEGRTLTNDATTEYYYYYADGWGCASSSSTAEFGSKSNQ